MSKIKISMLLSGIFLISSAVLARDANYGEQIIVAQQQNRMLIQPGEDLVEACSWATPLLGGVPAFSGASSDLYSVQTKKTNGSILKDDLKKVGSLLGCQSDLEGPLFERILFPTADVGQVIYLTLNGNDYIVTGSSRLRTNPIFGPGFPGPGMFLSGGTGTIQKPFTEADFPDNIQVVGSLSVNTISKPLGEGAFNSSSIFTFRLYGQ